MAGLLDEYQSLLQPDPEADKRGFYTGLISAGAALLAGRNQHVGNAAGQFARSIAQSYDPNAQMRRLQIAAMISDMQDKQEQRKTDRQNQEMFGNALQGILGSGTPKPIADQVSPQMVGSKDLPSVAIDPSSNVGQFAQQISQIPDPIERQAATEALWRQFPQMRPQVQANPRDQALQLYTLGMTAGLRGVKGADALMNGAKAFEPRKLESGNFYETPDGRREYIAKVDPGMSIGPNGQVTNVPGYLQALAGQKGAETSAQEAAKAPYAEPIVIKGAGPKGSDLIIPRVNMPGLNGVISAQPPEYNPTLQEELTRAKEAGKNAAETENSLNAAQSSLPQLDKTVSDLKELSKQSTYTLTGQARDAIARQFGTATQGAIAREKYIQTVRDVLFPQLRQTFGAQFTVKEGEALVATLGDPNKTPEERNAALDAFIDQKKQHIGSLRRQAGEAGSVRRYNPATGKIE